MISAEKGTKGGKLKKLSSSWKPIAGYPGAKNEIKISGEEKGFEETYFIDFDSCADDQFIYWLRK